MMKHIIRACDTTIKLMLITVACCLAISGSVYSAPPIADGLGAYYTAESGLIGSNGLPVNTAGAQVFDWHDLSGNFNTLHQYYGYTPVYEFVAGHPAVRFNTPAYGWAVMQTNSADSGTGLSNPEFTVFSVVYNWTNGTVGRVSHISESGDPYMQFDNEMIFAMLGAGVMEMQHNTGEASRLTHQTTPGASGVIVQSVAGPAATDMSLYLNGVMSTDTVAGAVA